MERKERYLKFFSDLRSSNVDLIESLKLMPATEDQSRTADLLRNGIIQKYEITVELLWKTTRIFVFEKDGIDYQSPRRAFKGLYLHGYVDEQTYQTLYRMVDMRNQLSHVYLQRLLMQALEEIPKHILVIEKVVKFFSSQEEE